MTTPWCKSHNRYLALITMLLLALCAGMSRGALALAPSVKLSTNQ